MSRYVYEKDADVFSTAYIALMPAAIVRTIKRYRGAQLHRKLGLSMSEILYLIVGEMRGYMQKRPRGGGDGRPHLFRL